MARFDATRSLQRRKGSVLVEYALLMAGIVLASVVAITVLGRKTADVIGVVAATLPGAQAADNKPIASADVIPLDTSGDSLKLDTAHLVNVDRYATMLGVKGGELLIVN